MARNVGLQILRGLKSNIPHLLVGEKYIATDTLELFIGTAAGNHSLTMAVFNATGIRQSVPHIVEDKITIPASGSVILTLTGDAVFTSASSYTCVAVCTNAKHAIEVKQVSGSAITFIGAGGDDVNFICIGV